MKTGKNLKFLVMLVVSLGLAGSAFGYTLAEDLNIYYTMDLADSTSGGAGGGSMLNSASGATSVGPIGDGNEIFLATDHGYTPGIIGDALILSNDGLAFDPNSIPYYNYENGNIIDITPEAESFEPDMRPFENKTISLWFKQTAQRDPALHQPGYDGTEYLFSSWFTYTTYIALVPNPDPNGGPDVLGFRAGATSSTAGAAGRSDWVTAEIEMNTWYHAAMVLKNVEGEVGYNMQACFYLNGELLARIDGLCRASDAFKWGAPHPWHLAAVGGYQVDETYTFSIPTGAMVDDFAIVDFPLGGSLVDYIYRLGLHHRMPISMVASHPIVYWPEPEDGSDGASPEQTLSWYPAYNGNATFHDVYFGTDFNDVNNATLSDLCGVYVGRQEANSIARENYWPTPLVMDNTYYWRIDEVNEADPCSPWKGPVWSFSFSYVCIDDFESYENHDDLDDIWKDYDTQTDPKTWCYAFLETDPPMVIDSQSMRLACFNAGPPYYSEVRRTFAQPQDWSPAGTDARILALSYLGQFDNPPAGIYVTLKDSLGAQATQWLSSDPDTCRTISWTEHLFALNEFTGIDLSKISRITIGVSTDPATPTAWVKIWVDNIRLYPAVGRMVYVDAADGNDMNDGLTPETAFATIQKGIDMAWDGDTVLVQPGLYLTADPNIVEYIHFGGKNITLTSTNPSDPNIVNNTIIGGGILFDGTEDTSCMLTGFTVRHIGNGAIYGNGTQATISHCNISGNGPCYAVVIKDCDGTISNCLITDNTVLHYCGDPIAVIWGCDGLIKNCTIANNIYGAYALDGGTMTIENCIIYNNGGFQLAGGSGATLNVSYCDIQGGLEGIAGEANVNWGPGNIDTDPLFVDPCNGDYHLKSAGWRYDAGFNPPRWTYDYVTSRCIDAGNPGSPLGNELLTIPDDPNQDWGVNLRINMGAFGGTAQASMPPYDWTLLGDLSNDGTVDFVDFAGQARDWLITANEQPGDLTRDSIVGIEDLAALVEDWLQTTDWGK